MARNGSGTYTKVNTFVSGNSITAAGHNQNWDDIASEITNSVAADGQTSMTGPLKASSGTAAAPGLTFASDPDSGLYRIGANNVGVAVNGSKVMDVATTGLTVTGTVEGTAVKQNGFALLPIGLGPLPWSGLTAPAGWVMANGQTLSRTTYAALWAFAAVEIAGGNTLYGAGDGSTTFTVTDMKGRVPAGKESSATLLTSTYFIGDSTTLGVKGGFESRTILTANLPPYTPAGTVSVLSSLTDWVRGTIAGFSSTSGGNLFQAGNGLSSLAAQQITSTGSLTGTAQGGTSTPIPIVQPTIITNYIIFAGV
jgi:microcystin-dependent protein